MPAVPDQNTLETVERLRALGAEVVELDIRWPDRIEWAYNAHMDQMFGASMIIQLEENRELMCDYNINAENGVPTGLQIVAKAYDDIAVFRVAAAFENDIYNDELHSPKLNKGNP